MIVNSEKQELVGGRRYKLWPGVIFLSGEVLVIDEHSRKVIDTYEFPAFAAAAAKYAELVATAKKEL